MSLQDYQQALELIEQNGGGDFEGAKPESLVAKAEFALGITFPPSYRSFLLEMGCGDINGFEVYGLINDNFEVSSIPNGIWMTLNLRRIIGLELKYVVIGEGGDGTLYAIDTSTKANDGESPVVRLSADGRQSQPIAGSFGRYLLREIEAVL